jgi:dipeptidyl aminopeptidase/acylaminoacyl peptidase
MSKRCRRRESQGIGIGLALLVVMLLTTGWWSANVTRKGQATVNVLAHRVEQWWARRSGMLISLDTGSISGTVYGENGQPLEGAVVVASDRYGKTVTAVTDERGYYVLEGVPVGRVVPAATRHGYEDQVYRRAIWEGTSTVRVRPNKTTSGADFYLRRYDAPDVPAGVTRWEQVTVSDDYPEPVSALRTRITFVRDGYEVACYLYEPILDSVAENALPGIVAAYPGETLNWEPASLAFVAQGYVVLGISPTSMRDLDVTADTEDLRAAMQLFYRGVLSDRVDSGRIGALGGSFSSMALMRALQREPYVRGAVLLGGLTDVYLLRHDTYHGGYTGYTVQPTFEWAMWSLGRPDRRPRMYVENSASLHARGLPPLCVIHGTGDAVIPYNQSERLAEMLAQAGQPHELHIYRGTGHYPGIHEPDPDTEAMYQDMVRFFARTLAPRPEIPFGDIWEQQDGLVGGYEQGVLV